MSQSGAGGVLWADTSESGSAKLKPLLPLAPNSLLLEIVPTALMDPFYVLKLDVAITFIMPGRHEFVVTSLTTHSVGIN